MALAISLPVVSKLFSSITVPFSNLQVPYLLLTTVVRRGVMKIANSAAVIANSLAILFCYFYLKNFKSHSTIIVDGYITIFKTFAEFVSAVVCLCYGLMETDLLYTALGFLGIAMGVMLKILFVYYKQHKPNDAVRAFTYCFSGLYIMGVLTCSFAFHAVATAAGVVPCLTRILTCIVPLVALTEFFRVNEPPGTYFSCLADFVAVSVLWWFCAHLSFKYFILVPSAIGLVFNFIQFQLMGIQKDTYKEM